MFVASIESDNAILAVHGDAIAVGIRLGRGDHWLRRYFGNFSDTPQCLCDLSPLQFELMLVTNVLITTTAAAAEVRTFGRDAMR